MVRILSNTSQNLQEEMNRSLEELVVRMIRSGHNHETTGRVISRGLQIHSKKLRDHREGTRKIHRRAKESLGDRRTRKLLINRTWFKPKTNKAEQDHKNRNPSRNKHPTTHKNMANKPPDTALFVPRTTGGSLATTLRQTEQNLNKVSKFKVKIVEECGSSL